jgi:hypothetical protein
MITTEGIESLLARNGDDFVVEAYRALLGRNPDQAGMRNYSEQVRLGVDKLDLLESFLIASEGKRVAAVWGPALARYRVLYRPGNSSSLLKRIKRVPFTVQRWIAPSTNTKAVLENEVESTHSEKVYGKHTRMHRMEEKIAVYQSIHWMPAVSAHEQAERLMKLSQPAQDIYIRLLAAIANNQSKINFK